MRRARSTSPPQSLHILAHSHPRDCVLFERQSVFPPSFCHWCSHSEPTPVFAENGETGGELAEGPGAFETEDGRVGCVDSGAVEPERLLAEGLDETRAVGEGTEAFDGVENGEV